MTFKNTIKKTLACLLACGTLCSLAACGQSEQDITTQEPFDSFVDYVTDSKRQEIEPDYESEPTVVLTDDDLPFDQRSYYHDANHFSSSHLKDAHSTFETSEYSNDEAEVVYTLRAGESIPDNFMIDGASLTEDGKLYLNGYDDYFELPDDLMGDIIGAYYSSFSREAVTYSMTSDGTVYLNAFKPDGNRDSSYGYNDVVYFEYGDDDIIVDKFLEAGLYRKSSGNMSYLYYYFVADEGIFYENINCSFGNLLIGNPVDIACEDIFAQSFCVDSSPMFTQDGNENALYYYYFNNKTDVREMAMPEGYTIHDIEDIFVLDTVVVVFNDDTVYYGNVGEFRITLELDEELTEHMQNGNVMGIRENNFKVVVDMINGCSYNFYPNGDSYSFW